MQQQADLVSTLEGAYKLVKQGQFQLTQIGQENTLFLGNTRGGKSTLVNYLLSNKLKAEKLNPNALGQEGRKIKIVKDGQSLGPAIGLSGKSETTFPQKWQAPNGAFNKVIWDCPGFADNRGAEVDIANAFLVSQLLGKAQNIRIVLVSDIADIISDSPKAFTDLIKQVHHLFDDSKQLIGSAILVVTKADRDYQVSDIAFDIKKITLDIKDPLFVQTLPFVNDIIQNQRISIFYKMYQEGPVNAQNAQLIAQAISNQIQPKSKLKVKVGISPDTQNFILTNEKQLSKFLENDLQFLLDKLSQLIDVKKITSSVQAQSQKDNLYDIKRQFEVLKPELITYTQKTVEVLQKAGLNDGLKQTKEKIDTKFAIMTFVQNLIGLQVLEGVFFMNRLQNVFLDLQGAISDCLTCWQYKENKITQQEMFNKQNEMQEMIEQYKNKINTENMKYRKLQENQAQEILKIMEKNQQLSKEVERQKIQNQNQAQQFQEVKNQNQQLSQQLEKAAQMLEIQKRHKQEFEEKLENLKIICAEQEEKLQNIQTTEVHHHHHTESWCSIQ